MKKNVMIGVVVGLAALAVYTASAHMGGFGYGFGMPGMMGYGYGYPMMGGYDADDGYVPAAYGNQAKPELTDVSGKVSAVYMMGVVLDDGRYVTLPWWFAANLGIKQGDDVKVKGFDYGNAILPVYIEVNGQSIGDENSSIPVWMQGYDGYAPAYGYGYGYGYHCPMMGW